MYDDVLFSLRTGAVRYSFSDDDQERNRILRHRIWEYFCEVVVQKFTAQTPTYEWSVFESVDTDDIFGSISEQILEAVGLKVEHDYFNKQASLDNRIKLENFVCESEWYHVYDFIEVVYRVLSKDLPSDFTLSINLILSSCLSRYRLIDGYVISVIDDNALAEISKALTWDGNISQHIKDALSEFSKRIDSNMSKVASSAISAVEASIVDAVNGKQNTLGQAFDVYQESLENGFKMNSRLVNAIKALYRYTCQGGIRHGGSDYERLDDIEARLVLIISAALTNYLNERNQVLRTSGSSTKKGTQEDDSN